MSTVHLPSQVDDDLLVTPAEISLEPSPPPDPDETSSDPPIAATEPEPQATTPRGPAYTELHRRYLTDRAIDLDLAWREGVRSLSEEDARRYSRCNDIVGTALGLPYGFVDDPYMRVQLDDRERNSGKTRALPGVTPPPYILMTTTKDAASPLFVVEAPPKALSMASAGFADVIGLGGVNAGCFIRGSREFQEAWKPYLPSGRVVCIIFDAGRVKNIRVAMSEAAIARAMLDFGCDARVVEMPDDPECGEGPDDFLAKHGGSAMKQLIERARPADPQAWSRALVADGPAVARRALSHLPFVAAVVEGGAGAVDGVATVLKAYVTRTEIKAACKDVRTQYHGKRAATGGPAGTGPGPAPGTTPQQPSGLQRGDEVELAQEHLQRIKKQAPVMYAEGETYFYRAGVWRVLSRSKQRVFLGKFAGATIASTGDQLHLRARDIRGALSHFEDLIADPEFFAEAPKGLVFANGFLRLRNETLALEPPSPDHRARFAYPFEFDRHATCLRWTEYLRTVWEGERDTEERIAALQEFVGAALFGCGPRYKTAMMLHGESDSGKSTCLDVVRGLFPAKAVTSISLHDFENEYRRAKLAGRLLNTVAEVPSEELIKSESFKAIIAGDQIEGRAIRQAPFDFTPLAAHLFAANTLPRVTDRSNAVWTRWLVLTFPRIFSRENTGPNRATVGLAQKILATDVPGIVAWAVAGFERLVANEGRYTRPASSTTALAQWRHDSNTVALFFDSELELHPPSSMRSSDLYAAYRIWCETNGFQKPLSHPTFGRELGNLLRQRTSTTVVTKAVRGYTFYEGVRRRPQPQDPGLELSQVLS
jgi:putative DNA primase/helicase